MMQCKLEAGSLFTEESCSFSQDDLMGNLALWLDKAQQILNTAGSNQASSRLQ